MFPPRHPARLQPLHGRLLSAFQLGHGASARGDVQHAGFARGAARRAVMLHSMHACSRADFVACASKRLLPGYRRIGMHGRVSESAAPPAQVSTSWCRGAEMGFRRHLRRAASALTGCCVNVSPPGGRSVCCCNVFRGSRYCYACRPCTNAWKETGYELKENSKVNGPKF